MIRILLHDVSNSPAIGKLSFVRLQVNCHRSTRFFTLYGLYFKFSLTFGGPAYSFVLRRFRGTGLDYNFVCNYKRRVKPDTKLADKLRILLLVSCERIQELGCAGLRNRTKVRDSLVAGHTNAVIRYGHGFGIFIHINANT